MLPDTLTSDGLFARTCKALGGARSEQKDRFDLPGDKLTDLFRALKIDDSPGDYPGRRLDVRLCKGGLSVAVPVEAGDEETLFNTWERKGKNWKRVWPYVEPVDVDLEDFDSWLRCVETQDSPLDRWQMKLADGRWHKRDTYEVRLVLQSRGLSATEASETIGGLVMEPWKLVAKPFVEHEDSEKAREINDGPQLSRKPKSGDIKHWRMIFEHISRDLGNPDWIPQWLAFILRHPNEPLPYLFLFGPQDSGKSILHEAFALLVTKGVVKADKSLKSDFNGELEGAVLCVVEETNVNSSASANRIKEVVTAKQLCIRRMRTDSYMVPNSTHWIQCANSAEECLILPGCSRIQAVEVKRPDKPIPKKILLERLTDEVPAVLDYLMELPLPTVEGRLGLPLIQTNTMKAVKESHTEPLLTWLSGKAGLRGSARELTDRAKAEDVITHHKGNSLRDIRKLRKYLDQHRYTLRALGVDYVEHPREHNHPAEIEIIAAA
ncbi:MAG: primase-helicase family protein [Pirellulales bacterium]